MNNIEQIIINDDFTNLKYVSTNYEKNFTLLELILDTIKKLNETILVVNSNNEFVNNNQNQLNYINNELATLKLKFENLTSEIDIKLTNEFNMLNSKIINLFNDYKIIFDNSLTTLKEDLEKQILNISLGQIQIYDPTTGVFNNVNQVVQNIYDSLRSNSITCQEFDNLLLTAINFDNKEITAFEFDINAKLLLVN